MSHKSQMSSFINIEGKLVSTLPKLGFPLLPVALASHLAGFSPMSTEPLFYTGYEIDKLVASTGDVFMRT